MEQDQPQAASEIESLLGERQQLQDWLSRLATASGAPIKVKDRVRSDYQGRLTEVVTRLRGFTTTLTSSLNEVKERLSQVQSVKAEVEEERAEAQLRHTVGEYEDEAWQKIDEECGGKLGQLGGDLEGLSGEIRRLEEVLGQIAPAEQNKRPSRTEERLDVQVIEPESVRLEPKQDLAPGEPVAVQDVDQVSELAAEVSKSRTTEAPRFTPRGGPETIRPKERGGRTIRFPQRPAEAAAPGVDEMTFLKSVAIESPEGEDVQQKRSGTNAKTLKCTECGSMNRPTEWYCERCGAELAAL